ncbi:MAG: response regulator [Candidatus Thiodiazotropha sp. (ex Epidulcina cf. delphinae)]|nr:response regulator [Candidatus Thiodiazotropha sp. (ex Epidulcina cf. delphinae)]
MIKEPLNLLLVEDNPGDARLIREYLAEVAEPIGKLVLAKRLSEAVDALAGQEFDAVLLDLSLPDSRGLNTINRVRGCAPELAVIILTGNKDEQLALEAVHYGAQDYLTKDDINGNLLSRAIRYAVERQRYVKLQHNILVQAIEMMTLAVDKRDPYTAGHQKRVACIAKAIAQEMGCSQTVIEGIHLGGLIHDIGKISIPAEILSRPGSLTNVEWLLIQEHPQEGFEIIRNIQFPWPVADMVMQHHERHDGSGYPNGLKGDEIIFEARILAVADVIEAMSSHRPYRPALGGDAALNEIEKQRGRLFKADVVDVALRLFREKGFVIG